MAEILVVDDDDIIRETLCELLSQHHACQSALTAEEALEFQPRARSGLGRLGVGRAKARTDGCASLHRPLRQTGILACPWPQDPKNDMGNEACSRLAPGRDLGRSRGLSR